jgi:membrane protein involved in colicin uptake
MKKTICTLLIAFASPASFSQSLQDQISAVNNAFQANQNAEQQRQNDIKRQAAEAQAKRDAQAAEQAKIAARERARNQAYEDEQRLLNLEERRAQVAASKAQAKRANDYIDADLKKKNAQADLVQSEADANRNISKGAGDMMSGVGKGAAKGLPNQTTNNNTNVLFK